MTIEILNNTGLLILQLPAGFIIGIATERLVSSNPVQLVIPSRFWTTLVRLVTAWISWRYIICFQLRVDGSGFDTKCFLPTASRFIDFTESNDGSSLECSIIDGVFVSLTLIFRSIFTCVAARLGSSLQPVGITGGIACGKSTVCKLLQKPSDADKKDAFSVIDLDLISHDILVPGKMGSDCGYQRVVDAFSGEDIFVKEENTASSNIRAIDRRKLGDIIFPDASKRRRLNGITHPLISKIMMKQIVSKSFFPSSVDGAIVSVEIPLLFEVGLKMKALFATKVVIACYPDIQLKRLMERNKDLTKEQCEKRIASQMPIMTKAKMADVVIWNNGTLEDLTGEVEKARAEVLSRANGYFGVTFIKAICVTCTVVSILCGYDTFGRY